MSRVEKYMRRKIATIGVDASAVEASKAMLANKVGYLIVLEGGAPVGMVTERDLVLKVMARDKIPQEADVRDFMSKPLVTIEPDKMVEDAVETMRKHGFRRLPVVENNVVIGIFTTRDLLQHFDEFEDELTRGLISLSLATPLI